MIFELIAQATEIQKKPSLKCLPEIVELIENDDKLKAILLTQTFANILESTHCRREARICKKAIVGLVGPCQKLRREVGTFGLFYQTMDHHLGESMLKFLFFVKDEAM